MSLKEKKNLCKSCLCIHTYYRVSPENSSRACESRRAHTHTNRFEKGKTKRGAYSFNEWNSLFERKMSEREKLSSLDGRKFSVSEKIIYFTYQKRCQWLKLTIFTIINNRSRRCWLWLWRKSKDLTKFSIERGELTWCARSASALRDSASRSCKLNESNMASDIHSASLDMSAIPPKNKKARC